MEVQAGPLFRKNLNAFNTDKRFIVNQGGTRSSKTYSILQVLIVIALKVRLSVSAVSISFPHLRRGAIRDFKEIMEAMGLYDPEAHTITDQTYHFKNGSYIEFFSADDSGKVRGPGRDILFINEANLFNEETFRQLNVRTKRKVFLDYNPADAIHWIYDTILPRQDTIFIQSTYKDNPFLPAEQVAQIESYQSADPEFWRVYGMGERGAGQAAIFSHFDYYDYVDYDYNFGLDFGFNHPNALVKCHYDDGRLYFEQCLYRSHVTTPELIDLIKPIVTSKYVYCDTARPEIITELRRAGINAYEATKNVKEGIDWMRSNRLYIQRNSIDLQKEMRQYKWKTKPNGEVLDEPVKIFDDLCDASRYAAMSFKNTYTAPVIFGHR